MNKVEYNGWTNYETWLVNLWMTNVQGGTAFTMEFLAERPDNFVVYKQNTVALAKFLKDIYEEDADELFSSRPLSDTNLFWKDLINSALSEVNWMEIARHRVEEWEEMQDE